MGIKLGYKQVRSVAPPFEGIADETFSRPLRITQEMLQQNKVVLGVERAPGCYPFRAVGRVNELEYSNYTLPVNVLADSNDTTCCITVSNFAEFVDPDVESVVGLRILWKKGNNPKGIAANPDIAKE